MSSNWRQDSKEAFTTAAKVASYEKTDTEQGDDAAFRRVIHISCLAGTKHHAITQIPVAFAV